MKSEKTKEELNWKNFLILWIIFFFKNPHQLKSLVDCISLKFTGTCKTCEQFQYEWMKISYIYIYKQTIVYVYGIDSFNK